jgi:hypothetical protein
LLSGIMLLSWVVSLLGVVLLFGRHAGTASMVGACVRQAAASFPAWRRRSSASLCAAVLIRPPA